MNIRLTNMPIIKFQPEVWDDIAAIVELSSKEVGWLGHVSKMGAIYIVDEIYVPTQEVESVTAEISPEGQIKCLDETGWDNINLWGHSHVDMGVEPSGQDDRMFIDLCENTEFFIRQVSNKRGQHHISIYDETRGILVEDIAPTLDIQAQTYAYWQDELKKKVSIKKYIQHNNMQQHLPVHYQQKGGPSSEAVKEHDANVIKQMVDASKLPDHIYDLE